MNRDFGVINKNFISQNPGRHVRYAKNLHKEIAEIIMKDLKDPGLTGFTSVLDVKLSKDLMIAHVKIRIFGSDKKTISKSLDALRRSSGYISSILGTNLKLRRSPKLIFLPVNDCEYENIWLKV